ncbi:MAG: hypothetical protein HQK62_06750 [Desulfamplus sp.]|nr:hypothetical protein [Desulfamplus sp.]MBF0258526.1 hypothetical protein [Desulfamplus sp.]
MDEQLNEESNNALNGESIELLELEDDSFESATVRKSFRIPVRKKDRFLIVIEDTSFPIEDLNVKGAGVLMVEDKSFFKDQILSNCELILGDDKFSGVECQIVHITSVKESPPLFGVKWLNMDAETVRAGKKQIGEICEALKRDLLDDSGQDGENGNILSDSIQAANNNHVQG